MKLLEESKQENEQPGQFSRLSPAIVLFRACFSGSTDSRTLAVLQETPLFPKKGRDFLSLFPSESRKSFFQILKEGKDCYFLALTVKDTPVLFVTHFARYDGLCVAFALPASPSEVLSFLDRMPTLSVRKDSAFSKLRAARESDPEVLRNLDFLFRKIFLLFESSLHMIPECNDPFTLFRLFRTRVQMASDLLQIPVNFLLPYSFDTPMQQHLTIDSALLTAGIFLQLFAFLRFGITVQKERRPVSIVFLLVDGCPTVSVHFKVASDAFFSSEFYSLPKRFFERSGCYYCSVSGELARLQAEKIPGIRQNVAGDRYLLGDHLLTLFSPARRDWSVYTGKSTVFRLPDSFYTYSDSDASESFTPLNHSERNGETL